MNASRVLIIPAAGRGTRLTASVPKPLVPVAGRPMLDHLFAIFAPWVGRFVLIVNPGSEAAIRAHCANRGDVDFAIQEAATGMLDAILLASDAVRATVADPIWITWSDQIAVRTETAAELAHASDDPTVAMALPTLHRQEPYTHLERDANGRIVRVRYRRENDLMPAWGESEIGLFSLSRSTYLSELPEFAATAGRESGAATGERNFLPFIPWLAARQQVVTFPATEDIEAVGVNTPEELTIVEAALRARR
jgi:bifunctional N-acetylglucosamine-1-phosphate-uridyltransferase/glucosamine-1-phosphate-acetyltransferase GlmU-like protein